jgi:pyruvate formate lyase activating enzyme
MKDCKPINGRIQSVHSFSTFDGPGTRCVVFFQGCPVKCIFCHNPDSWSPSGGEVVEVAELLRRLERFRPFLQTPGLTLSGGEPLFQPGFALELINGAKALGWHVALDTSGWGPEDRFAAVAGTAQLIKHPLTPEKVTSYDFQQVLMNYRRLKSLPIKVWLRYVLIPGWTDEPESLQTLKRLALELPNLEKVEILPYNSLAENKWAKLGVENPFFNLVRASVTEEQIRLAEEMMKF